MSTKFVELSHLIENGMPAYPGIPGPQISALLDHAASRPRYEHKAEFYMSKIEISGNTGTYLDSPFHRDIDRNDLSEIGLEAVAALPAVVVDADADAGRAIDVRVTEEDIGGRALLIRTGWDERWGSEDYWTPGPYLSDSCVRMLVETRPRLVGVDFWNVDDTNNPERPAHTKLLRSGILIVEHLCNLGALPVTGSYFYAVPLRLKGGASFPVRAFAEIRH